MNAFLLPPMTAEDAASVQRGQFVVRCDTLGVKFDHKVRRDVRTLLYVGVDDTHTTDTGVVLIRAGSLSGHTQWPDGWALATSFALDDRDEKPTHTINRLRVPPPRVWSRKTYTSSDKKQHDLFAGGDR
jgi:hypothetical protein